MCACAGVYGNFTNQTKTVHPPAIELLEIDSVVSFSPS